VFGFFFCSVSGHHLESRFAPFLFLFLGASVDLCFSLRGSGRFVCCWVFFLVDLPVESKVSCGEFRELVPGKEVVTLCFFFFFFFVGGGGF
jgi:hypothetical protein